MKKLALALALTIACMVSPVTVRGAETFNKFSVLTFNVFDPFFGPEREQRMERLAGAVMELDPVPDVMVFDEFFKQRDRDRFLADLKQAGYPVTTAYYVKKQYGTGLLLVSRFELTAAEFTPFRVDGAVYDFEHYAGKGVMHYRLKTPAGPLELFATHPMARFKYLYDDAGNHVDRDRKTADRILEMERVARLILAQADPGARSVVLAGDLNVSPDMWGYQYLMARTGMVDSFAALHPGDPGSTYSPENSFVDKEWYAIDHILFENREGSSGFWLRPTQSEVVFKQLITLSNGKRVNLSDHFGVLTAFEVVPDRGGASISSGFRPGKVEGERSLSDLGGEGLVLTSENHLAWQKWAVDELDRLERNYNRLCPAAIPAGRIVIAGDVTAPVVVPLSVMERATLKMSLKNLERETSGD